MLPRTSVVNQVAQAEAGGEEGGAAGGSRTLPPARAGGAARATHEGPAVRGRQTVQVHRARGIRLLRHGDPGDPGDPGRAKDSKDAVSARSDLLRSIIHPDETELHCLNFGCTLGLLSKTGGRRFDIAVTLLFTADRRDK